MLEHAVAVAVAVLEPPVVGAPQRRVGLLEQRAVAGEEEDAQGDVGADRRLRAVDPLGVGGQQAGEVALRLLAGQRDLQVGARGRRVAGAGGEQRVEEHVVEPHAPAAELRLRPVAGQEREPALVGVVEGGVPGHDVADRARRLGAAAGLGGARVDQGAHLERRALAARPWRRRSPRRARSVVARLRLAVEAQDRPAPGRLLGVGPVVAALPRAPRAARRGRRRAPRRSAARTARGRRGGCGGGRARARAACRGRPAGRGGRGSGRCSGPPRRRRGSRARAAARSAAPTRRSRARSAARRARTGRPWRARAGRASPPARPRRPRSSRRPCARAAARWGSRSSGPRSPRTPRAGAPARSGGARATPGGRCPTCSSGARG